MKKREGNTIKIDYIMADDFFNFIDNLKQSNLNENEKQYFKV